MLILSKRLLCVCALTALGAWSSYSATITVNDQSNTEVNTEVGPSNVGTNPPIVLPGNSGILPDFTNIVLTLPKTPSTTTSGNLNPGIFDTPLILSVRGRVVRVQVPAGYSQVSLERKTIRRSQPWVQVASQSCDAIGGEATFRLRTPLPKRVLRVAGVKNTTTNTTPGSGTANHAHPSVFYADTSSTSAGTGTPSAPSAPGSGGLSLSDGVSITADNAVNGGLSLSQNFASSVQISTRAVVESDIWKREGDRLYIYNPYRGLLVLDVSKPGEPVLLGDLYLPQSGDALYVLDRNHVALITHTASSLMWNQQPGQGQESGVIICDVSSGVPKRVKTLAVPGQVTESRLVGDALYVASQVSSDQPWNGPQEIQVTGFDLSQPEKPAQRNTVAVTLKTQNSSGYLNAVQASDHYFLVASQIWAYDPAASISDYRTHLGVVDISSPTGQVRLRGEIKVDGMVEDKFKMQEQGGIVSVVSNHWWSSGSSQHTHLENFSLANPDRPKSLGQLDLGENEMVYGTRFDGDRVYIVTFRQVDPLWIVDNSNPAHPAIAGHVQVPGYSTYLEPMGDRLVTLGFVWNQLTVSLFDVADAKNPKLIQQLPVSDNWVYSDATWNEKAFTVLPDDGLIMLPITESWFWNWDDVDAVPPQSGIQLIDLKRDSLTLRGRIAQPFAPRRSLIHRQAVLALGDTSLLTADITDRDQPQIVSDVTLATATRFLWRTGTYLIEIGNDASARRNELRVASQDLPNSPINSIDLGADTVVAADFRDGYMYVLQRPVSNVITLGGASRTPLRLSIYNVDSVPKLVKTGETTFLDEEGLMGYQPKFLWPQPGTLVLAGAPFYFSFYITNDLAPTPGPGLVNVISDASNLTVSSGVANTSFAANSLMFAPIWWGPRSRALFAVDVSDAKHPAFLGLRKIEPRGRVGFSDAFCANGKVLFSYQYQWFYRWWSTTDWMTLTDSSAPDDTKVTDPGDDLTLLFGRHFLEVVDYANPSDPVVQPPVSAPGVLKSVAHGGSLLYMIGPDYSDDGHPKPGTSNAVQAVQYDGTKLELLATTAAEESGYYSSVLALEDRVFVNGYRPASDASQSWRYSTALYGFDGSEFKKLGEFDQPSGSMAAFGQILLSTGYADASYSGLSLTAVDFSNPAELKVLGHLSLGGLYPVPASGVGNATDGFWFPVDFNGVLHVDLPK